MNAVKQCGCGKLAVVPWRTGFRLPDETSLHVISGPSAVFVACDPGDESGICGDHASERMESLMEHNRKLESALHILRDTFVVKMHEFMPAVDTNGCFICGGPVVSPLHFGRSPL